MGRKKTNVMFIGDGKGKTVITGKKNVIDGMTTFHTASFGTFLFHRCLLIILMLVVSNYTNFSYLFAL